MPNREKEKVNEETLDGIGEALLKKLALELEMQAKYDEVLEMMTEERRRCKKRQLACKKAITAVRLSRGKPVEEFKRIIGNHFYEIEQNKSKLNLVGFGKKTEENKEDTEHQTDN